MKNFTASENQKLSKNEMEKLTGGCFFCKVIEPAIMITAGSLIGGPLGFASIGLGAKKLTENFGIE